LLVVMAGTSVLVVARSVEPRTYASTSVTAALFDVAAGVGLIAAGGHWLLSEQQASIGVVSALSGVAWLSTDWIGWDDGPPIARAVAMVVAPFLLALLVHLSSAVPDGAIRGRIAAIVVSLVYGITAVVSLGMALWRDPFYDRYCWSNCTDNSFLVHAEPGLARALTTFWMMFSLATAIALAAACIVRLARASLTALRRLIPVLAPITVFAIGQTLLSGQLLADRVEDPRREQLSAVFYMRAVALVAIAAGVVWIVQRRRYTRGALAQLATDLGTAPRPGALRSALARSLGDGRLQIAYWLPAAERYVDGEGRPVEPHPDPAQAITAIERNGHTVAIVTHDRSLQRTHHLAQEIGAAARLVVDNERLRAQALAQVRELRSSRTRIIETADDTRRTLERNLHDGAQQRLLALSYTLQLAQVEARAGGDTRRASVFDTATAEVTKALEELRDLANGIYPSILADSGLGPALASFIDIAPLRVELVDVPDERLDTSVETAAYHTVVAGVSHATNREAARVAATLSLVGDTLVIRLTHDGSGTSGDVLIDVGDRIGALGGQLDVSDRVIEAVIPCG
jgi:signal transduction histidine kinase